jgi:hypothetical protein
VAEPTPQGALRHRHHRPQHLPPDMVCMLTTNHHRACLLASPRLVGSF